jgi:hypothetical protein
MLYQIECTGIHALSGRRSWSHGDDGWRLSDANTRLGTNVTRAKGVATAFGRRLPHPLELALTGRPLLPSSSSVKSHLFLGILCLKDSCLSGVDRAVHFSQITLLGSLLKMPICHHSHPQYIVAHSIDPCSFR